MEKETVYSTFQQFSGDPDFQLERINQKTSIRSNLWPFLVTYFQLTQVDFCYVCNRRLENGQVEWGPSIRISRQNQLSHKAHRHNFYELVYVLSGELTHHLEHSVFHYQAGDAILLNQGIHHYEGYETDCEVLFVGLYPEYFETLLHTNPIMPEDSQYSAAGIPNFLANSQTTHSREYLNFTYTLEQRQRGGLSPVASLAEQLLDQMKRRPAGYAYTAQGLLLQICALLETPRYYHMQHVNVDATTDELLYSRIVRFLEERNGRVTRSELGSAMHYNGDYLNSVVKRHSGMTLHGLGQHICAEAAARLLQETKQPVAEIIQQLGYSNQTSFYRMFRSHMGCSPSDYRKTKTRLSNR